MPLLEAGNLNKDKHTEQIRVREFSVPGTWWIGTRAEQKKMFYPARALKYSNKHTFKKRKAPSSKWSDTKITNAAAVFFELVREEDRRWNKKSKDGVEELWMPHEDYLQHSNNITNSAAAVTAQGHCRDV